MNNKQLRFIIRNGEKVLQYLDIRSYNDGLGHVDTIEEWKDVPTEKE